MSMDFVFQDGQKSYNFLTVFYTFILKPPFKDRSQSILLYWVLAGSIRKTDLVFCRI